MCLVVIIGISPANADDDAAPALFAELNFPSGGTTDARGNVFVFHLPSGFANAVLRWTLTSGPQQSISPVSLALAETDALGGQTVLGTVSLIATADAGGAVATLSSSDPAVATVPASVIVPERQLSATKVISSVREVTISPTYLNDNRATLRVKPARDRHLFPAAMSP